MIDVFAWMAFFNTKDVGPIVFDIPPGEPDVEKVALQ